jgi:hypothetical protein
MATKNSLSGLSHVCTYLYISQKDGRSGFIKLIPCIASYVNREALSSHRSTVAHDQAKTFGMKGMPNHPNFLYIHTLERVVYVS